MATKLEIEDIAHTNIDHSKKALVPSFKLALIKDLHRNNGRIFDGAA